MTQEEKELLLKDLCSRLPYKVIGLYTWKCKRSYDKELTGNLYDELESSWNSIAEDSQFLPYLRPMSSMTDEERYELRSIFNQDIDFDEIGIHILNRDCNRLSYLELQAIVNFFYSHHLDWCGMIPKRLALEAPENMYKEQNMKYGRE